MNNLKTWQCITCGFIYSEKDGIPEEGISAGTPWQDVPEDWLCPDCGMGKDDFQMEEVASGQLGF
jgi:rubredoxin